MDPKKIKYNIDNDKKFITNTSDENLNESDDIKESSNNSSNDELQYITE